MAVSGLFEYVWYSYGYICLILNRWLVSDKTSRRKFLVGTSTAVTGGLAGCIGDVLNSNSKNSNNEPSATNTSSSTPEGSATESATEASRSELRNKISELETRVQKLEAASQSQVEEIDSLEEDLSSARSKLESRNEELDSLKQELQQREQRIEELESQTSQQSDFSEETLSQFSSVAETVRQAVVTITGNSGGTGTAWFVDSNTLVTNAHVVDGSDSFECFTIDGDSFSPTLLGASDYFNNPYHDVAVLETDYTAQTSLSIGDSTSLERDQPVLQVGHPYSVGNWVISIGRYQSDGFGDTIHTSVPNESGNSGSPLVNSDGDVVGLTTGNTSEGSGSSGDPEPVEFELKEEYEDTSVTIHDTSSIINKYLKEFR